MPNLPHALVLESLESQDKMESLKVNKETPQSALSSTVSSKSR